MLETPKQAHMLYTHVALQLSSAKPGASRNITKTPNHVSVAKQLLLHTHNHNHAQVCGAGARLCHKLLSNATLPSSPHLNLRAPGSWCKASPRALWKCARCWPGIRLFTGEAAQSLLLRGGCGGSIGRGGRQGCWPAMMLAAASQRQVQRYKPMKYIAAAFLEVDIGCSAFLTICALLGACKQMLNAFQRHSRCTLC